MLVLSRKKNETVVIGGEVTVRVLEIKGHVVRLGIVAPKEMQVFRGEIQAQIDERSGVPSMAWFTKSGETTT